MSRCDIDFNLYELFDVEALCRWDCYKDLNKNILDLIITEARSFAIKEMLPTYVDGDKIGPLFENGDVKLPKSFKRVYKLACEREWTAPSASRDYGGQGLPHIIAAAIREYIWLSPGRGA